MTTSPQPPPTDETPSQGGEPRSASKTKKDNEHDRELANPPPHIDCQQIPAPHMYYKPQGDFHHMAVPGFLGAAGLTGLLGATLYLQDGRRVHVHKAHFRQDSLPGVPAGLSVYNVLQKQILSADGARGRRRGGAGGGVAVENLPSICEALGCIPSTTNQYKPKYV